MNLNDWLPNKLAHSTWRDKYQNNDETFDEWLDRVSNGDPDLKQLIVDKKFIFGGRILANRGLQDQGTKITYSNCYVLKPPDDNIESIYDTCGKLARTFSYGGGVGIDISNLRPNGAPVHNAAKTTTGACSFMDTFAQVTDTIGQKGRRGALMLSMDISHPDIEEFIDKKTNTDKVTSANISVKVTDDFMNAVVTKQKYTCSYLLEDGSLITKEVDADKLFEKLAKNNWDYAEPGILYWDNINNNNLLSEYIKAGDFAYAGVNPCAEEPLPAGGACNLGAINLSKFVLDPYTETAIIDYTELAYTIYKAVYAINDLLIEGADLHPLEMQRESVKKYRQIGLGVMGFADMLIKLGITYGSEESIKIIDELGSFILYHAIIASNDYMKEKGLEPFYGYDAERLKRSKPIRNLLENIEYNADKLCKALEEGLFNSQLLTIAPTGSIAGMLDTSYGAEPFFSLKYTRKTKSLNGGEEVTYLIDNTQAEEYKELHDLSVSDELPGFFITTHQVPVENRVKVQATWQKYIDASISSTVNLPKSATVEDVKQAYIYAWQQGCKGLTIYRAGCKRDAILTEASKEEETEVPVFEMKNESGLQFGDTLLIDNNVRGVYRELTTGCGHLHCNFYFDPDTGDLRQVFLDKGSKGGCLSMLNAVSRLSSLCARKGAPAEEIVDQLLSVVDCPAYQVSKHVTHATSKGSSCASAVAYALLDAHKEFCEEYGINEYEDEDMPEPKKTVKPKITKEKVKEKANSLDDYYTTCPACGKKTLLAIGGCVSCQNPECSWSKCG